MSSWYDWIPGVSNVAGLAKGNAAQAIFGVPDVAKNYFFDDPANEQKQGYDKAAQMSADSSKNIENFWMQQQAKAQANYKPLQNMFAASYGTKGMQAPVLPGAGPGPKVGG